MTVAGFPTQIGQDGFATLFDPEARPGEGGDRSGRLVALAVVTIMVVFHLLGFLVALGSVSHDGSSFVVKKCEVDVSVGLAWLLFVSFLGVVLLAVLFCRKSIFMRKRD